MLANNIKFITVVRKLLYHITILSTFNSDGRTDGQTDGQDAYNAARPHNKT